MKAKTPMITFLTVKTKVRPQQNVLEMNQDLRTQMRHRYVNAASFFQMENNLSRFGNWKSIFSHPKVNGGDEDGGAASNNVDEEEEETNEEAADKKPTTDNGDAKSTSGDTEKEQERLQLTVVDSEHLQLTVIDSDKLDTSNVDNEDSLNLTIGEDEAKIFQDEVSI